MQHRDTETRQESPEPHCQAERQGKESILPAQPPAPSSQQFYHPKTCGCLAIHPRQAAKAGVSGEQDWSGTSPPGRGSLHPACQRYLPRQLSHLSSLKTGSPMALWGRTKQTGPRAAGAAAEPAVSLQTLGRKAAFGPFLVSGV